MIRLKVPAEYKYAAKERKIPPNIVAGKPGYNIKPDIGGDNMDGRRVTRAVWGEVLRDGSFFV